MAIHPIDLSTMYSNMEHVSRNVASQQMSTDATKQFSENSAVQQAIEKQNQVKATAENDARSTTVDKDGRGGSGTPDKKNAGEKSENQEKEQPRKVIEFRESYLGQHIDIQG